MAEKKKSIPVKTLIRQLEDNGSEATIDWYATEMNMPKEKAASAVALRIFKADDDGTLKDDTLIDEVLCRAMWRKYITDKVVDELIQRSMTVDRFGRKDKIEEDLYSMGIEYPTSDFIIRAMYIVFYELRNGDGTSTDNEHESEEDDDGYDEYEEDENIEDERNWFDFWGREER